MKNYIVLLFSISLLSCHPRQEGNVASKITLAIDEVSIPIPEDMPNDWESVTTSIEGGEKVVHIYDRFKKKIVKFNLDRNVALTNLPSFSDELNIGNFPFALHKRKDGYFLSSTAFGFIILDEVGNVLKIWDNYIPRSAPLKNWAYDSKFRLRTYKTSVQSMFDDWTTPILVEIANIGFDAVYRDDFTKHDIFGQLDLKDGELKIFPIRFPEEFNANGYSYPTHFLPSFTSMGEFKLAYSFGIDEKIYILNTQSGQIEEFKVSNPNFPVNISPIDKASFYDPVYMQDFNSKISYYGSLYYDPYRKGLIRVGFKTGGRIIELLDENMNIVAQFEQAEYYSGRPLFFPNEIWFPYLQGYKEDTMKLMRVRY